MKICISISYRVKNIIGNIIRVQRYNVLVHRGGFIVTESDVAELSATHQTRRNVSNANRGTCEIMTGRLCETVHCELGGAVSGPV